MEMEIKKRCIQNNSHHYQPLFLWLSAAILFYRFHLILMFLFWFDFDILVIKYLVHPKIKIK